MAKLANHAGTQRRFVLWRSMDCFVRMLCRLAPWWYGWCVVIIVGMRYLHHAANYPVIRPAIYHAI